MPSSAFGGGVAYSVSASAIVAQPAKGSHVLKIDGYSRIKVAGVDNDRFITSDPFDVGGISWVIRYYPDGEIPESSGWISLFLHLNSRPTAGVEATWEFSLLDRVGVPTMRSGEATHTFTYGCGGWGVPNFIRRNAMAGYLKDDCFRVRCDVTVWTAVRSGSIPRAPRVVTVPPSDMLQHMGRLLETKVGTDVTFLVGEETFAAHRPVLAARSPVFMAQLFGQMKETTTNHVRIDDMEPRVFRAMLHFVYTDSLPEMDSGGDGAAMAQHLLVAADKYGMERLKLICEDRLCDYIYTGTALTTLELAEQYGFRGLKEACFKFLKSPGNLKRIMDSDEFQPLTTRFPSLLRELLANVAL